MKTSLLALLLGLGTLMATDYSAMNIDELKSLRGTVPTEDKAAFQSAMQTKMQSLTPEERKATMSKSQSGSQDSSGQKMRKGGSGGQGRR